MDTGTEGILPAADLGTFPLESTLGIPVGVGVGAVGAAGKASEAGRTCSTLGRTGGEVVLEATAADQKGGSLKLRFSRTRIPGPARMVSWNQGTHRCSFLWVLRSV